MMGQLSILTASLETVQLPSIGLRQKANDLPDNVDPQQLRQLVSEMVFALYAARGVGLAAPQVGVGWRLFLAMERDSEAPPSVFINPRLIDLSDEIVEGREGCLSLPGYVSLKVPRSTTVVVEALNQHLEPVRVDASDFLARVIQHEYDHLDGILYIDRLKSRDDLVVETSETRAQNAIEALFARETAQL